ncbi:hypothetical protein [Marinilactibacillus psychrotolerans]|uniref:Uncharacterized protein n=1 Tax=Marinilactibacillus psychrotolerans TaxID=191770 RepID=A0AAV3WU94_9LACT|nr:hypothetical protein [Marinilactibacillus psychrotolerans]GEL68202.1 hypothetical protein MPS01_23570 [Marinilactibacillus psychrotolerans]GEQ35698.1 hypothetical protein M132T_12060 [Marinilactibacillus psychrotolerans]
MSDEEKKYRTWIGNNGLALNQLNGVFFEMQVGYDPLHLTTMIENNEDSRFPKYHGIFNQIK